MSVPCPLLVGLIVGAEPAAKEQDAGSTPLNWPIIGPHWTLLYILR